MGGARRSWTNNRAPLQAASGPRRPCPVTTLGFGAAALLVTVGTAACLRAQEPVVGGPVVVDASAPNPSAPVAPPRETAADGTASVVVPAGPRSAEPRTATPPRPGVAAPAAVSPPPPGGLAVELLAESLDPAAGQGGNRAPDPLAARPLPLLEAIERSGDRARRLWIAQQYWKVSSACAVVRSAAAAIERLELVAPGGDPHDRATLDVAVAAARADLAEARAQLGVAQQELVDLAKLPPGEPLPWPIDMPLAGPYQTHFDAIFANRMATGRVRAIARTLPSRHEALEARAAAVRAARTAMAMAESDHAKGRRPIEAVIAAHAAVVGQEREFAQAVKAYNLEIAEYAMAVADLSVPDDRFVAMLIGAPIQWRPSTPAAGPVGGER